MLVLYIVQEQAICEVGTVGGGDLLKNNADSMAYLVHFLYKHIFLSGFMLKFIIFVYIGGILGCINAFWIY